MFSNTVNLIEIFMENKLAIEQFTREI